MRNKELGKEIWKMLRLSGFYADNFETWFEDCFRECIEEACNSVDSFEKGGWIEIGKSISKDGNPHIIDFEPENFIEFYGLESCQEMFGFTVRTGEEINELYDTDLFIEKELYIDDDNNDIIPLKSI